MEERLIDVWTMVERLIAREREDEGKIADWRERGWRKD